jgi:hypothetical protein
VRRGLPFFYAIIPVFESLQDPRGKVYQQGILSLILSVAANVPQNSRFAAATEVDQSCCDERGPPPTENYLFAAAANSHCLSLIKWWTLCLQSSSALTGTRHTGVSWFGE